jgi:hypothetical protein
MRIVKPLALACAAAAVVAAPAGAATAFRIPIKLTPTFGFGGYEPGLSVDKFGNILVTAHKQNHGDVVSPDTQSASGARTQSWVWWSKDDGKTFAGPPGLTPAQEQTLEFGDEGDLATDDAGHTYFVDTNVADVTFTRWKSNGLGNLTLETTRPVLPAGEPVDDRPWVIAHGANTVLYLGNEGDTQTYPLGQQNAGDANGPGRYTVYRSYDTGNTFDSLGYTLNDSGWCRPAWDRVPNDQRFVVFCTAQTAGAARTNLYSFVSTDDGVSWTRHIAGTFNAKDPLNSTWPCATIASDGTVYALVDDHTTDAGGNITGTALTLFKSADGGVTWTHRILPSTKFTQYSWMDVAPDGTLGVAYYGRNAANQDWHLYAGTAPTTGDNPDYADLGEVASSAQTSPFGDFFETQFDRNSKLSVVWTVENSDLQVEGLNSDIYYAHQQ